MAELKSLTEDTAIYGANSIIGKFLSYFLVPVYTFSPPAASGGYGVITRIYVIVALSFVVLTFGMETDFFRSASRGGDDPKKVHSVSLLMVGSVSSLSLLLCLVFLNSIAGLMGYSRYPWYLGMMLIVLAMDVIQAAPSTYLRYKKRPIKFTGLKSLFILVGILLNILYFAIVKGDDVGVAFPINPICSFIVILGLIPKFRGFRYCPDRLLTERILYYSFPILILGMVGTVNQVGDKIILPFVCPGKVEADVQLGIYSVTTRITVIMAMITQVFRFVYEPFVFGKSKDKDNRRIYAQAIKFFIISTLLAFLAVISYLDILRYIIAEDYWERLKVVPIVMITKMFIGIYFSLSFWYRLTDNTRWGTYFFIITCLTVVLMNIFLTPAYEYVVCAWASFTEYAMTMLFSYFVGQEKYLIAYDLRGIGCYMDLAIILYLVDEWMPIHNTVLLPAFRTVFLPLFIAYIIKQDLSLSQTPVINWIIKKK